jgi:hypothetical protein
MARSLQNCNVSHGVGSKEDVAAVVAATVGVRGRERVLREGERRERALHMYVYAGWVHQAVVR